MTRSTYVKKIVVYSILTLFAVIFLIPLFWMVSTSLKPDDQVMVVPIKWIPSPPKWDNYFQAVKSFPFFRYLLNTSLLVVLNVIGTVITGSLVAYSFAKLKWKGRDLFFYITVATMFLPTHVLIVPLYIMYSKLGWVNTYLPLIVPSFLGGGAFTVFLLRQFFMSLPNELIEAAKIDGAPELMIFFKIIMPLSKPALITVSIFTVLFVWNDFFGPLIYLHKSELWTLAIGLRSFQQRYSTNWNLLMAASNLVSLPMIIGYFFLQDKIINGFKLRGGVSR